jgi:hypothetical protein
VPKLLALHPVPTTVPTDLLVLPDPVALSHLRIVMVMVGLEPQLTVVTMEPMELASQTETHTMLLSLFRPHAHTTRWLTNTPLKFP